MNSGSGSGSESECLAEEEGSRGMRGVKKDWSERRDSRAHCGGESALMKVRRMGRLLT